MLNHHLIPLQETGTYLQGIDRRGQEKQLQ